MSEFEAIMAYAYIPIQEVWPIVKSVLPSMVGDVAVAIPLLSHFKPAVQTDEELRAQKRPRTDGWAFRWLTDLHCLIFSQF
jgi:hypothetical protein